MTEHCGQWWRCYDEKDPACQQCKTCREHDASNGKSRVPTVDESAAFSGAYYLRAAPGDAPFDHGASMESTMRQLGAWLEHGQQVYASLQRYATNALAEFEQPATLEPIPAAAIVHHAQNLASGLPPAHAATIAEPTMAAPIATSGAVTVGTNYAATIDHARSLIVVAVDLSIRNNDSKAKDGSQNYHNCKLPRGQRTIRLENGKLCFTLSVGSHTTPHKDAQSYDTLGATINANHRGMTPAQNIGAYRRGDTLHIYSHFDARRTNAVTLANGSRLWARSTALSNAKRRAVYLDDGSWFTFRLWTTT